MSIARLPEHERRRAVSKLEVNLRLVGGPTLLLERGGFRVLTDPTFDSPSKQEAGGVGLEKTAGPALTADEVGARQARIDQDLKAAEL